MKREEIIQKIEDMHPLQWKTEDILSAQQALMSLNEGLDQSHPNYDKNFELLWMLQNIQSLQNEQNLIAKNQSQFARANRVQQLEFELGLLEQQPSQEVDFDLAQERTLSTDANMAMQLMEQQKAQKVQEIEEALMEQGLTQIQAKEMAQEIESPKVRTDSVRADSVKAALTTQQQKAREDVEAKAKQAHEKARNAKIEVSEAEPEKDKPKNR